MIYCSPFSTILNLKLYLQCLLAKIKRWPRFNATLVFGLTLSETDVIEISSLIQRIEMSSLVQRIEGMEDIIFIGLNLDYSRFKPILIKVNLSSLRLINLEANICQKHA